MVGQVVHCTKVPEGVSRGGNLASTLFT
jgi:hypothetical protein